MSKLGMSIVYCLLSVKAACMLLQVDHTTASSQACLQAVNRGSIWQGQEPASGDGEVGELSDQGGGATLGKRRRPCSIAPSLTPILESSQDGRISGASQAAAKQHSIGHSGAATSPAELNHPGLRLAGLFICGEAAALPRQHALARLQTSSSPPR